MFKDVVSTESYGVCCCVYTQRPSSPTETCLYPWLLRVKSLVDIDSWLHLIRVLRFAVIVSAVN